MILTIVIPFFYTSTICYSIPQQVNWTASFCDCQRKESERKRLHVPIKKSVSFVTPSSALIPAFNLLIHLSVRGRGGGAHMHKGGD
jgi:hypothetical protein